MTPNKNQDFALAVAYCLAYDHFGIAPDWEVLLRFRNGKEPQTDREHLLTQILEAADFAFHIPASNVSPLEHLQQIQEKAAALGDLKVALIAGGATKIKQYVFESSKLPEIRGASALLDDINLVDLPALFSRFLPDLGQEEQDRVQTVRGQFLRRYGGQLLDCPKCVVYANGGEILAFAPTCLAQALADEIEFLYTSVTLIANSVAVWRPFRLVELAGGVQPLEIWQRLLADEEYKRALLQEMKLQSIDELKEKKRFGELAAALAVEKFRRREGNPNCGDDGIIIRASKSTVQWETFAYGRRCRSCERRVASHEYSMGEEDPQLVCQVCLQKLQVGWKSKRAWAVSFEDFLRDKKQEANYYLVDPGRLKEDLQGKYSQRWWDKQSLPDRPKDLGEIGQASKPEGYIGVIYADGNNMGALLERLHTPEMYRHFADAVYEATKKAVFQALTNSLHPVRIDREEMRKKRKITRKLEIHPFEVLSIGGDDLFLIVPANKALAIGIDIAQRVENTLRDDSFFRIENPDSYKPSQVHRCVLNSDQEQESRLPQSKVSLSVGVLLADAHTPIFFLQDLVEQLLKTAKGKAKRLKKERNYFGGTIDFMALKSVTMLTGKLGQFREDTLRLEDGSHLTARPYTLQEMRRLIDTVQQFKMAGFPRSQLYALRQSLWAGRLPSTVNYLYFTERLGEKDRNQIRDVLDNRWCEGAPAPWRRISSNDEWETILFDVLELYDFVAE